MSDAATTLIDEHRELEPEILARLAPPGHHLPEKAAGGMAILANQQDAAIDALRREHLRLIALTPLRTSLEAYFVEKLQRAETSPATSAGGSVGRSAGSTV